MSSIANKVLWLAVGAAIVIGWFTPPPMWGGGMFVAGSDCEFDPAQFESARLGGYREGLEEGVLMGLGFREQGRAEDAPVIMLTTPEEPAEEP
ncbi:MAG: hypothetical protein F4220_05505 [Gammaproteobacteria bacterium]|nr:hypothetical protein [Gammaproteobacteria bacterium]